MGGDRQMQQHRNFDLNLATYVGIDVHPGTHTAFAINRFEDEKGHLCFDNSANGITQFLTWLTKVEVDSDNLIIGVEGRGGNGHALVSRLLDNYKCVYEVNSLYTKQRRSYGTRRDKTDAIDAKLIAEVLTRKVSELPVISKTEYLPQRLSLQRTVCFYEETTVEGARLKNQLHKLKQELNLNTDKTVRHLLAFELKEKKADLTRITKRQKLLVKELEVLLEENGKNLTTIKGVNTITAARILAHLNGIERFPNVDSFILYAGIAPVAKSSGKLHRHKQNHKGNRKLNSDLYLVALNQLRWHPQSKAYFEKKVKEGKTKKHAIRCLMKRTACIIYGMLKSGEAYRVVEA
jgi:transposase